MLLCDCCRVVSRTGSVLYTILVHGQRIKASVSIPGNCSKNRTVTLAGASWSHQRRATVPRRFDLRVRRRFGMQSPAWNTTLSLIILCLRLGTPFLQVHACVRGTLWRRSPRLSEVQLANARAVSASLLEARGIEFPSNAAPADARSARGSVAVVVQQRRSIRKRQAKALEPRRLAAGCTGNFRVPAP